ncbi:MAG TPA: MFS transporter [Vicinamibacterales bacterium]|jgi:ACS family hexuronate transporter-like MFS transporter|nr:MFS transporter [Vicinamibacterales bacterium]
MALPVERAKEIPVPVSARAGHYRWAVCGLLFLATTINYIDRQVIGILKPLLQRQYGWSEIDYGDLVFAFQLAYAIGFLFAGRLMDRFGTKRGYAFALTVWSVAAIATAWAPIYGAPMSAVLAVFGMTYSASVAGFLLARFVLGLGEAGNFPAAIKTVAEWFPRRERALATGIFNAGTNVGAIITPAVVPFIAVRFGWEWAFIGTGVAGLGWLVIWWLMYQQPEQHPRVSAGELAYICSDPPDTTKRVPWLTLLPHRQTWAFAIGKLMTDPIWWLYLFWMPDFFSRNYGLSLLELGPPIIVIYLVADIGSVGGGWLSSSLIRRGWSVNAARKTAMLICATAVVPIVFASRANSMWEAVALVSLAASAHQGWSANLFTLTSDMFPRHAVGSVVGIGGFAGAIGGMVIAKITGYILQTTGSYLPVFIIASTTYLVTLVIVHTLVPKLEPAKL